MDKLDKLYTGVFIVFLMLTFYVIYHYYNLEDDTVVDLNNNGIIESEEIKFHIKKELDRRSKQPPRFHGIVKSCISGIFRGFLMGMLLNGWEGAITSAIVLGTINPIVTGIEHTF